MVPPQVFEKVREFIVRLVKDQNFLAQLQSETIDNAEKILRDAGYVFSQEQFENATLQLLDLKERDEFHELTEAELTGAVGGFFFGRFPLPQPLYGVIVEPPVDEKPGPYPYPKPRPWPYPKPSPIEPPIDVQPMYGVVVDPIDPIIQPMYGVIVASE